MRIWEFLVVMGTFSTIGVLRLRIIACFVGLAMFVGGLFVLWLKNGGDLGVFFSLININSIGYGVVARLHLSTAIGVRRWCCLRSRIGGIWVGQRVGIRAEKCGWVWQSGGYRVGESWVSCGSSCRLIGCRQGLWWSSGGWRVRRLSGFSVRLIGRRFLTRWWGSWGNGWVRQPIGRRYPNGR